MTVRRERICGLAAVESALVAGRPLRLLLLDRQDTRPEVEALAARARRIGATVIRTSPRELWRLATPGAPTDALALAALPPRAGLGELLGRSGPVWLLSGMRYPGNTGFAIRTAEVSGAAGVAVDARFEGGTRRDALRAAMGAHRFFPVLFRESAEVVAAARRAGRRVIAIEDRGGTSPFKVDLRPPSLLVVGGERDGIPPGILGEADEVIRIPMRGFIPAYNVQAAMAIVTGEWLRQSSD